MRFATAPLLLLLSALLWAGAAWIRLRALDQVAIGSDSLGPYLQALAATEANLRAGFLPHPPNPESGDWLWVCAVPFVRLARSLHELFAARFIAGAAIAPLGAIGAFIWAAPDHLAGLWTTATRRQWAAALSAGAVLAVDPGLTDTLISGARSYGAPELVALLTVLLGLAWHRDRLALLLAGVVAVIATGHHPFAAGLALGGLMLLPGLGDRHGVVTIATAAVLAVLAASPRIFRLLLLANCGDDPLTCLAGVAQSNVDPGLPLETVFQDALQDRFLVELGLEVSVGMGVGILLSRPWLGAGALAIGSTAGIAGIAWVTGYLQGYHLRILAAPLAVAAAVGLGRLWPLALAWGGFAAWTLHDRVPVGPDPGALDRHDAIAERLAALDGPLWVDRAWWGGDPALDASAVVLSAVLQHQAPDSFTIGPDVPVVLLSVGPGPEPGTRGVERLMEGVVASSNTPWKLLRFDDQAAARRWIGRASEPPHQLGGAWDWLVALHPQDASLEAVRW